MVVSWKTYLESHGAVFDNKTVINYGNAKQELTYLNSDKYSIITDFSYYGVIKITGSDAQSFLQSQFSNDVALVNNTKAQLNSYCSPKGRILALFNLFQIQNDYYLQLPKVLLESILKRLTLYKMRAEVTLEDYSNTLLCIGIAGSNLESILLDNFKQLPHNIYDSDIQNDLTVIRVPAKNDTQARILIFGSNEKITAFWTKNKTKLTPVAYAAWSLLDIQSGIPQVATELVDVFIPQMLNLQLINGVSFKKGCFPGQEIVARTQYLGKLKKRMYLIKSNFDQILDPGTDLSFEQATDEQSKGKIVTCQHAPDGGIDALAVLQINCINQGQIITIQNDQVKFTVHELPYAFEKPAQSS